MASTASKTNALFDQSKQRPTENDKVPVVNAGGPRNDGEPIKTGSTADYADFGFDAVQGIKSDTTVASTAGVPAQPSGGIPKAQPSGPSGALPAGDGSADAPNPAEGSNAPDPGTDDIADAEKLVREAVEGDEEDDLSGIDLDELAGDDVDLIDLPTDTVEEEDCDPTEGDCDPEDKLEEEDGEEDEDDKPLFTSESHARRTYRKLKGLFEAEDQTDGKRDDEKEEIPSGDDPAPVAEGLFDDEDEDEDDLEGAEVTEETDPLTTQSDEPNDPNAPTEGTNDEVGLGESKKLRKESKKFRMKIKFNEGKKLFEGSTVLSEEDVRQSRALFESAVRTVAADIAKQLREAYQKRYVAAKLRNEAIATKRLDQYLSYVVEQWTKDNKVALRSQLRAKLSENFVRGLKKLFVENYVEVPASKVNVVTALARNVKSLKEQVQKSEQKNVALAAELKEVGLRGNRALVKEHKTRLIAEAANHLPASERGAFTARATTVRFTGTKSFRKDLVALREQYAVADKVGKEHQLAVPIAAPLFEQRDPTRVDSYVDALGKITR